MPHGLRRGCEHSFLALAAVRAKTLCGLPLAGPGAGPALRPPPSTVHRSDWHHHGDRQGDGCGEGNEAKMTEAAQTAPGARQGGAGCADQATGPSARSRVQQRGCQRALLGGPDRGRSIRTEATQAAQRAGIVSRR
jgi:hypothetical protein